MLDLDPDAVMIEIRAAEQLRQRIIANTTTLVRRYVGNWYRSDQRNGKPRPENMIFNFVAGTLPRMAFDNPAVTVSAMRSITHKPVARYMQMGINGWIKEVNLRTELELLALDMLFSYGCALVTLEPRGDYSGTSAGVAGRFTQDALTPALVRLPPANVIIDSQCDMPAGLGARLLGHMYQRDLSDLQGDDRFDQRVVERLTADDEQRVGREPSEQAFRDAGKAENRNLRGRVTLYDLYIPETRQIGSLALYGDGKSGWIRPLTSYKGPRQGPYVFFGVYLVPEQVYPLSPIAAMAEQDQELNAHASAAAREAASAKNLVLVSADQTELAQQIESAPMNSVLKVKGLNGQNVLPLAIGGTTEQRLVYLNLLLQRTDRTSGQSEATRGRATGVTATEAQLADASGDARMEFLDLKYRDAVKDALNRVGWYFFNDPAVVAPVSFTDPATGMESEGVFLGGIQPGQEDMDWSQFFLDIEPMSMRRVDPQQQQQTAQLVLETAMMIGPAVIQMPYVNWIEILDLLGEAYNIPDFSRLVFNAAGLQLISEGMAAGPMPGLNPQLPGLLPANAARGVHLAALGAPVRLMREPGGAGGGIARQSPTAAAAAAGPSMRSGGAGAAPPASAASGR